MEIAWIRSFTAVVENGGYQEAAFELFLSQSVISKHIQKMEAELGTELFSREHRKAELTPEGEKVYREAKLLLRQYQKLIRAAEKEKHLLIGMMPVADCYSFPEFLAEFRKQNPEIELLYKEETNTGLPGLVLQNKADGAFYRVKNGEKIPENSILCREEDLVLLCREDFLKGRTEAEAKDLDGVSIMVPDRSTGLYEACMQAFERAEREPDIIYTGSSGTIMARLIRQNVGAAILARGVAEHICTEGLKILPFRPEVKSRIVFAVSEKAAGKPEMQLLMKLVVEKMDNI